MIIPKEKPEFIFKEKTGIIGKVKRLLRAYGADNEYINHYIQESMCSQSDQLIDIARKYVEVVPAK